MYKKAQGLSLNTIIIAIIVLTVLVVLILIFSGSMADFINKFRSCENKGASFECKDVDKDSSCEKTYSGYSSTGFRCDGDKTCCQKVASS